MLSSVTQAMKAKQLLKKQSIYSEVVKTSRYSTKKGCGYSIVLYKNIEQGVQILKENGIEILNITGEGQK